MWYIKFVLRVQLSQVKDKPDQESADIKSAFNSLVDRIAEEFEQVSKNMNARLQLLEKKYVYSYLFRQ